MKASVILSRLIIINRQVFEKYMKKETISLSMYHQQTSLPISISQHSLLPYSSYRHLFQVFSFSGPAPSYCLPVSPGLLFPTLKLIECIFDD